MVSRIALVSAARHDYTVPLSGDPVQISCQHGIAGMVSPVCPHTDTYDHRPFAHFRKAIQVFQCHSDIRIAISRHAVRYQIVIPQILLRFLAFHHHDIRIRRSA